MDGIKSLWHRFQLTGIWRAWKRYGDARGNLLAGGVTYFSFFSIFPAIALAFTVFGLVLRGQPELLAEVRAAIDQQLPGFVQSEDGGSGLIPIAIPSGSTLGITALVGVLGVLWAGMKFLGALREGIREIFGAPGAPGNMALALLRDLLVLVTLGLGIVVVAAVNAITNAIATTVADAIGLGGQGWLVTVVGITASLLANTLLVALMLRVLSGVDLPRVALRRGALFGGVAMTFLQLFGTRLIAGTMSDPLFASIALVVGLLLFLNFIARAMLMSAAWAANDLDTTRAASDATAADATQDLPAPASRLPQDAAGRADVGLPTLNTRAADRVTLASGAVLGAAGATLVGMSLRAARSLVRLR